MKKYTIFSLPGPAVELEPSILGLYVECFTTLLQLLAMFHESFYSSLLSMPEAGNEPTIL